MATTTNGAVQAPAEPDFGESFHQRLQWVQATLACPKGRNNDFGKYRYRNGEDILEAAKPLLMAAGLTILLSDEIIRIGKRYYVKATASLSDGQETATATAYAREAIDRKGMDSAQITGACSSYARKYALSGLLAIDDGRDADSMPRKESREDRAKRATGQLATFQQWAANKCERFAQLWQGYAREHELHPKPVGEALPSPLELARVTADAAVFERRIGPCPKSMDVWQWAQVQAGGLYTDATEWVEEVYRQFHTLKFKALRAAALKMKELEAVSISSAVDRPYGPLAPPTEAEKENSRMAAREQNVDQIATELKAEMAKRASQAQPPSKPEPAAPSVETPKPTMPSSIGFDGRELYMKLRADDPEGEMGVLHHVKAWGREHHFPEQMVAWSVAQADAGWQEALRFVRLASGEAVPRVDPATVPYETRGNWGNGGRYQGD